MRTIFLVIGGILVVAALIWGRTGYYASQTPILFGLLGAGGILVFIASKMPSKK